MKLVDTTRSWLQLFRAHTVVLEAPMAILGAAIGIGTFLDPRVGLWAIFGACYHLVGYGMNSYVDWAKGYDKDDERKQHHPLNTGDISPDTAKKAIYVSTIGLAIFALAIGGFSMTAVIFTIVMFGSGLTYNFLGKQLTLKPIPISIAHTTVFLYPYYLYSGEITIYAGAITAAYFIHHIYQIAVSGDIKDIDQDEASLLKYMGAEIVEVPTKKVKAFSASQLSLSFAFILTSIEMLFGIGAAIQQAGFGYVIILGGIFGAATLYETDKMLTPGEFLRSKRLEHISRREFAGYSMIHVASIPIIGWQNFGLLIACMVLYLVTVSKFIWGTWITPDV